MNDCIYMADARYYEEICAAFGRNRTILPSVRHPELCAPVCFHPDMMLCPMGKGVVVCAPEVFETYQKILSPFGINLVQGEKELKGSYPQDIAYNVLDTKKAIFSLAEKTEPTLLRLAEEQHKSSVRVAQGYARCSALAFGEAVISADPSILKAADVHGLTVLSVQPGHVLLPGYDYGFIGGASGVLENGQIAFFGDLSHHPDGEAIRRFVKVQGFSAMEISGRPLTDVGTILRIDL